MAAPDLSTHEIALPAISHPDRLAELSRTGVVDGGADEIFDRFARLAAALLRAPVSYVSLVGQQQQLLPGAAWADGPGDDSRTMPLRQSVCAFSVVTGDETIVDDLRTDPLTRSSLELQELGFGAYAGYPLTTEDGHVLGNLCVLDRNARHWEDEELASLRELAALVRQELQHRITRSRLSALQQEVVAVLAEVPPAREAVRVLVDAAGRTEDPQLHRAASIATARLDRLVRTSAGVRDGEGDGVDPSVVIPDDVNVARTVRRAVQGTRAVTGADLVVEIPADADGATLRCDMLALERALSHLLVTVLHHSVGAPPRISVHCSGEALELSLHAEGARVPASQLGRAVARLDAAVRPGGPSGQAGRRAAVRMSGGRVLAAAGAVEGAVSTDGVVVRARWGA